MADTNFPDEWLAHSLEGVLTPELLVELRTKAQAGQTLWETLVAQKVVNDEQILTALSTRFRLKLADVKEVDLTVKEKVPEQLARRYQILPLRVTDSFLEIATANPFDLDAEKALAFATAREIRMQLLAPSKISEKLDEVYRPEKALDKMFQQMEGSPELVQLVEEVGPDEIAVSEEQASQRPIVLLVDLIISGAILARSSDIHIEPEEGGVAVRYRVDGVLRQQMKIPRQAGLPLISRIKIMSSLDIADRLRPQDGRARVAVNGQPIDLRVSTLPAALGEKAVIRILYSRATVKTLDSLGLSPDEVESLRRLLENHEGILLVTGPTGSGKTTTLYSCINQIKSEGVNIVTVEDPVEYRMQGIVQVQVQEKAGLTFASALRSILRQDPNVVLVGEIRDRETAQIAVQASLTGHLVLSTLHTNDAANAVTRLVDIGVEAYKIAAALRGVLAQRLMRKLCPTCKEVWMEAPADRLKRWVPKGTPLYRAAGCPDCAMTGYRGRRLRGAGAHRRPRGVDALRAAGGARAAASVRAARVAGAQGAARGRRGQPAQGRERSARARRLHRLRGARRGAGPRSSRPGGAGHHRARPQHARARRLRRAVPPAFASRDRRHPGHRAHGEERRRQRGAGVRAGRRRLPHEAVPGARAVGAAGGRAGPAAIRDASTKTCESVSSTRTCFGPAPPASKCSCCVAHLAAAPRGRGRRCTGTSSPARRRCRRRCASCAKKPASSPTGCTTCRGWRRSTGTRRTKSS